MTQFARGSRHGLSYIEESVPGVTPATISMKEFRHTSCSLQLGKSGFQSRELRSDRQISDYRHGVRQVSGDIGIELSYETFNDFIEGLLFSSWSTLATMSVTTLSADQSASAFLDSSSGFTGYHIGDWISVAGFTTGTDVNNGIFKVTGYTSSTLTVEGTLSDASSGATVTIVNHPRVANGTELHSYTVERAYEGMDTAQYHRFSGCMVNSLGLTIPVDGILNGTFGIVGMGCSTATVTLGIPSPAPSKKPFDSFRGSLSEGGTRNQAMTSLSLNIANSIQPAFVIGSDTASGLIDGRCAVTGTIEAYFKNSDAFDKFRDETESNLTLMLEDIPPGTTRGNQYRLHIPRLTFTSAEIPANDEGGIIVKLGFQALKSDRYGYTISLARIDAD